MTDLQQRILAAKRQTLSNLQSTIPLSAGTQTTHSRTIQSDTPQPLPAYPAPGAAAVTILSYQVPASMSGALTSLCIVHIGAAGSFTDGSGVVVWRVLINGVPQKGLESLYVQIGSQTQLSSMFLLLRENDLVTVTAQIPAGKVAPVGNPFARILGYLDYGGLGSQAPQSTPQSRGQQAQATTTTTVGSGTGGTVGGGGGGGSCFTGNSVFRVPGGYMRFDAAPAVVTIENKTGRHVADLIVHDAAENVIDFYKGQGVTFEHLIEHGANNWIAAEMKYEGSPLMFYKGKLYNLHVRTQRPEDQHFILGNGDVAHNMKMRPSII